MVHSHWPSSTQFEHFQTVMQAIYLSVSVHNSFSVSVNTPLEGQKKDLQLVFVAILILSEQSKRRTVAHCPLSHHVIKLFDHGGRLKNHLKCMNSSQYFFKYYR